MDHSDTNERIERLKQVLADSYPQQAEGQEREPLPESIRAALRGERVAEPRPEPLKASWIERLGNFFRTPQLAAVAATAMVVLLAVLVLNRPGLSTAGGPDGGQDIRSTGPDAGLPSVVVLHRLGDDRAAELESSGYFREGQLLRVPDGTELGAFLESQRRPNLVLVDGETGEISTPFAGDGTSAAVPFAAADDLAGRILDALSELPESGEEAE